MPRKPKKPPWSAEPGRIVYPSLQGLPPVKPEPMTEAPVTPGTASLMGDMHPARVEETDHECFRCVRIKDGRDPLGLDHTPRCPFRDSGKDPDRN